jgi:hypothetical protein
MSCLILAFLPHPRHSRKKQLRLVCTPKGKGNDENIFDVDVDVDDDETQLLLEDLHPHGLVCPQNFSEVAIISQSSHSESRFGPLSASKAQFGTMTLPLIGMHVLPAPTNLEIHHMSSYLNGDVGPVAPSASGQKLPVRDVEAISASRNKRHAIETGILAGPIFFQ